MVSILFYFALSTFDAILPNHISWYSNTKSYRNNSRILRHLELCRHRNPDLARISHWPHRRLTWPGTDCSSLQTHPSILPFRWFVCELFSQHNAPMNGTWIWPNLQPCHRRQRYHHPKIRIFLWNRLLETQIKMRLWNTFAPPPSNGNKVWFYSWPTHPLSDSIVWTLI